MKKTIFTTFALLVALQCLGSPIPDFPFISVRGEASSEVPPNIGRIHFQIRITDAESANALEAIEHQSHEVLRTLKEAGIEQESIDAFEVEKRQLREGGRYGQGEISGMEVSRRFFVTIPDITIYSTVIEKLLAVEGTTDFNSTFDRKDREAIEAKLLKDASRNAISRAEAMAEGFGIDLGSIYAISKEPEAYSRLWATFSPDSRGAAELMMEEPPRSTIFAPSTITLTAEIYALFRIIEQ